MVEIPSRSPQVSQHAASPRLGQAIRSVRIQTTGDLFFLKAFDIRVESIQSFVAR